MNKRDFLVHDSLCPLPWTGIFVNPDGQIRNCAISRADLGNIHETDLDEILTGPVNQTIRKDMLAGQRHARCDACYQVEDNAGNRHHNQSNRSWYTKLAIRHHQDLEIFDHTDRFLPTVLDLRWRNTCNRACIYCGPDLSSLWQDMMDMEYKIDESVLERSKNYIFQNLSTVKHVYLAGGEPLVIKENQALLERLLEINPGVEIRINSNIGNINTPVFRLLERFSNVMWTISVDSMAQSFEYMRWPGRWDEFLTNLKTIQGLVGDRINFNMVWCILNDRDILSTVDFLIDQGFHENMFIIQCLTSPWTLSVINLPVAERDQLKNSLLYRRARADTNYWLYKSLSSMYNFLDNPKIGRLTMFFDRIPLEPGLAGTVKFLQAIDAMRGTNSRDIFQRLYQYQ